MATKAPPIPWYQSRTVWVLLGAVLSNVLAMLGALGLLHLSAEASAAVLAVWNSILALLGILFRWQAQGPLGSGGSSSSTSAAPLLLLCCLLVLPVASACPGGMHSPTTAAQLTPAQRLWSSYGEPLTVAAGLYEDTMREAGRLHAEGVLTDQQLSQVRTAGRSAAAALRLARSSLSAYLAHETNSPPGSEILAAQGAVSSLLELAGAVGVTR